MGHGTIITTSMVHLHECIKNSCIVETYQDSSASSMLLEIITNDQYLWYKEGITEPLATKTSYSFYRSTFAGQTATTTGGSLCL
jgi:agmatine/peptidylarginine deiminase